MQPSTIPAQGMTNKIAVALSVAAMYGCSSSGLGADCDPAASGACEVGLACLADPDGVARCLVPAGGECDLGAGDALQCGGDATCLEVTEIDAEGAEQTLGRCLVSEGGLCDPAEPYCADDYACEEMTDGTTTCQAPLYFLGRVFDSATDAAIDEAHVIGIDDESVAVTDVAISGVDGTYELRVPAPREADGTPVSTSFTLRASADGYQTFPGGLRTALPIHTSEATSTERGWVVQGTITDVALIELADPSAARVSISGTVVADLPNGVLVVAEGADGVGYSAISDAAGGYTIFNVPPGDYEVRGYKADLQLVPAVASATADRTGVDLLVSDAPLTTISGSINIVNAFGGAATSVVLVVESTFSDTFGRGEVPAGLRAPRRGPVSISGGFSIEGVPDGRYVVLAAFENDRLVRDPDQNIAGTGLVVVEVPQDGTEVRLADAFKVTEALAVAGPGATAPTGVSSAPMLEWEDDSSEDYYTVEVYDAYGDLAWSVPELAGVSGSDTVSVQYAGPMEIGMYYQFRATSWRRPGGRDDSPISTTEDLLGVFHVTQ